MRSALLAAFLTLIVASAAAQTPRPSLQERLYVAYHDASLRGWEAGDHLAVGNLWRDMGDLNRALAHWQASYDAFPALELGRQLAELYIAQGRYAQALDTLLQAHRIAPDDRFTNAMLGFLLAASDPQGAAPYLNAVAFDEAYGDAALPLSSLIASETQSPQYASRVGAALASTGRYALAEAAFRQAVADQYPYPAAMAQVGWMRTLQNKDGQAWIQLAVALAPQDASVRLTQALLLRSQGAYQEAIQALELALNAEPQNPVLYTEMANTYTALGMDDAATQWQMQADALQTDD
jgi:tetratricopeptide (TPR) repeat protein